ncbi:MAG: glycosyltransferase family 2 protein [Clostridia bacterium]
MPKVSVIVPIYNVEKYLPKCLESLVNQTLEDIQIILVNDGSTDNSGQIAKEYANKYPKKIIYLEKENGGLSDARNYGIPRATGEYIAFLDSDDYIEKNAYEEMYNKAVEENSDYVECDFLWEYPNKIRKDTRIEYNNKQEMMANVRVVAWNKLIKRNIIEENDIRFPKGLRYEDVEFTYKLIPHLNKASYINKYFVHYVQRDNSIANVQNERTAEIFTILDNVIEYYKQNNLYEQYKTEIEYNYARYLLCSSLKRMCKIQDKAKRKELLNKTWSNLNTKFPNWKENEIIKNDKSLKTVYMKTVNDFTYKIYCILL